MRITDMHVDGFGVWNALSVPEMSERMTLFFGPNEAGKTTLMQFVRTVLYGFSDERRRLYLPPVRGGEPGGMVRVRTHSGEYLIERRLSKDEDGNRSGRAIVLSENGKRQGQHLLDVLLSGIDESIFNNVFAVGIREMQELATLNDTQAAEQLYNLASGVDRVSLIEVMRELEAARRRVWAPLDQPSEIGTLLGQREKLQHELGELRQQSRRWIDLTRQRVSLIEEVAQLDESLERFGSDRTITETALKVRDRWKARVDAGRELRALGQIEPLPEGCLERLDELNAAIEQQRTVIKPLDTRRKQVRRELVAQPINKALWAQASRIEAVCEHAPWIAAIDGQLDRLQKELESGEKELRQQQEHLLLDGDVEFANLPLVSPKILDQLSGPAKVLSEAAKRRSDARNRKRQSEQHAATSASELKEELAQRKHDDLEDALQRAGDLVSNLRRRVQLEDRLEQMWRHRDELEEEHNRLLDEQLSRVQVVGGIGLMYVFGFVLLLTGMFGWTIMPMSTEIGWGIALLGALCLGLSVVWKVILERTEYDEFEGCTKRRAVLDSELEHALDERDKLEELLPNGKGPYSSRLTTAERELKDLEAMVPLSEGRREAEKKSQIAHQRASAVSSDFREAKARWRRALQAASLPATLTPKHVRQLAAHYQETDKQRLRVVEQRQKLEQLRTERAALVERIQQLTREVGLSTAAENPHVQLSQLATLLAGQREIADRRRELTQEERTLRRTMAVESRKLRQFLRSREALFAQARVTDEPELRERADRLEQSRQWQAKLRELNEQIQSILGGQCEEAEIEAELAEYDAASLKLRRDQLAARIQEAQTRLANLHQRRGEINQELKALVDNKRVDVAHLELAVLDKKVELAVKRWTQLSVTLRLLEVVRDTYEAERQPETLSEASDYLEKLTEGRYTRIWTPLGTHVLRVDDNHGNCLSLEVLSRGTREAVFLSLRLALAAAYARRGISIPLILDDVLVNLDKRRAEAAVRTLNEFAQKGHQLLFFTCHEHITEMFLDAEVEVRLLPSNQEVGAVAKPLLREALVPPEPVVESPPEREVVELQIPDELVVDPRLAETSLELPPVPSDPVPSEPIVEEISLEEPAPITPPTDDDWDYRLEDDYSADTPRFDPRDMLWEGDELFDDQRLWWEPSDKLEKGEAAA